jgi:gamma-glutamyltranspeptidase/glutathione hydrolase
MLKNILFLSAVISCSALSAMANESNSIGAISTGHPLATQAGLKVLKQGGNAFDAAVAVSATLNVVEPAMSGLGGYGTTLIYDAKRKKVYYLNSSGKFPIKTNPDLMRPPTKDYLQNLVGPKSISTPGNLNAWKVMHDKYGTLPWAGLFDDATYYAEKGFAVSPFIAKVIAAYFDGFSDYSKSFYGKDGRPLKEGEILIQKDLAKTYRLIAEHGVDPFYRGDIAVMIDKQMKAIGSFLSIDDLRMDVAQWWDPISIHYKGYDVYTMGTPGNGFVALFTLGVMGEFPLHKLIHNSALYLHTLAEVLKASSKVRLTTPGTVDERSIIVNHLLSPQHFAAVAHSIPMEKASNFDMDGEKEGNNTTHFVIIDKWGNIVSSTQTLGNGFGSKVMIEGTGIWMNNSITFSPDALPGKYKLSSNSPIIIMRHGQPWAALGTPGGHTIPQNTAQIMINLIDFNMNMQAAIDSPKLAFFEEDKVICTESDIPASTVSSLKKMGHMIGNEHIVQYLGANGLIGNAMGIKILRDGQAISYDVGIDKRRDGWATYD